MSDTEPAAASAQNPPAEGAEVAPQAVTPAATAAGSGISFGFTYNSVTYNVKVYAPDQSGQYGFTVTQAATSTQAAVTVASLIYKDDNDWQILASLPSALQVDTSLTVSQLSVEITKGTVAALS